MSRYTVRQDEAFEVTVGYDDPLDTFFAQVLDVLASREGDDDVYVLLTGRSPREVTNVGAVVAQVEEWADVPASVVQMLATDLVNRRQPTGTQRQIFRSLTGEELP